MIKRRSYTPVVPWITIADSRAKCIPVFRSKRHKNPTVQGGTYLAGTREPVWDACASWSLKNEKGLGFRCWGLGDRLTDSDELGHFICRPDSYFTRNRISYALSRKWLFLKIVLLVFLVSFFSPSWTLPLATLMWTHVWWSATLAPHMNFVVDVTIGGCCLLFHLQCR